MTVLAADWPAPEGIRAFTTLRPGGTSFEPYESLNLGAHVGDDAERVRQNRRLVRDNQGWSTEPLWLDQVHGTTVVKAEDGTPGEIPRADGAVTFQPHRPLVVMTADCLPVVACDRTGTVIGAFHAGWRGLLAGVLERGLEAMDRPAEQVLMWIGPAIGAESYQVGPEVREAYLASHGDHEADFRADGPGHWKFDLAGAAARRMRNRGVEVAVSPWDTYDHADAFFSHRRQNPCGRMGTFICWEPRSDL